MRRRPALLLGAGVVALLLLALLLRLLLQPERVTGFVLDSLGNALGLEITAGGSSEYRLRGTPMLVVRDVVAREPGAATPLLRARRILVSVPWSTVRSRGERLDIVRIELDAPVLDLPALQHWLAARPPGETRLPTLSDGLRVVDGRIDGDGWRVENLALSLPRLHRDQRVDAHAEGTLHIGTPRAGTSGTDAFALRFDVAAAMTKPAGDAGIAIVGPVTASAGDWRLPARLKLSAPLHVGDDGIRSERLRASASGRYESGDTRLPFAFAISSPLLLRGATVALTPAGIALRGDGAMPNLDAAGALAWGKRLLLELDGRIQDWPDAWPALPPPLGTSDSPLPFALRYLGRADFSDPVALRIARDDTRFDARLRVPDITGWLSAADDGSPLPPLSGHLVVPRLEISGAQLEGVEIDFDEPTLPAPKQTP